MGHAQLEATAGEGRPGNTGRREATTPGRGESPSTRQELAKLAQGFCLGKQRTTGGTPPAPSEDAGWRHVRATGWKTTAGYEVSSCLDVNREKWYRWGGGLGRRPRTAEFRFVRK